MIFSDKTVLDDIRRSGAITSDDVLRLRREVFRDGVVSLREAEAIFALNDRITGQCAQWHSFFVEAMTDFTVHQAEPRGYVTEANAKWLIDHISLDGRIQGETELELLVQVLETATASPENLSAYALEQVKEAVLEGESPLRQGDILKANVISAEEVELLRRILYAFSGDGAVAISRAEAEILFDLNDATSENENDPSWSDLFVKAVANFLMASNGYHVPTRQEAIRREQWLDSHSTMSGHFSSMLAGGLRGILNAYREPSLREQAEARLSAQKEEIAEAEQITLDEAEWLTSRIGRDGILHDNEKALIEFIQNESPQMHPVLRDFAQQFDLQAA